MKGNLTITGSSTAIGGQYDKVKIVGEGNIEGDVQCNQLRCVGTMDMDGSLHAEHMSVVGTCSWTGGVQGNALKISGTVSVSGDAKIGKISGAGTLEARGDLYSDRLELKGQLVTAGDCEAEEFKIRGMFEVGGLLNAGEMDIKLYRISSAKEIGGEKIRIRRASVLSPYSFFFMPASDAQLTVDVIEGDDIDLEYTKARVVRGNRVTIGAGCEIELVEYKESLQRKKDAVIHANSKK
ncbi:hypothetical protein [Paenibacillus aceris]|uniref:Cytoskeletal protein CcmA (Bactofilin family) n=1 Tax=Paenibacillus aceris TaxID=869555 RepID=A0ABS4HW40_9BACL|nr:hypothetical protein [Paenibacillus aceris]MBP1962735.1 cytoskeletal protein CcmA (bactofilin family) [Paenibacillus aceris]NHW33902.1 hypothetical protein [Paenibacillus aceris]